MSPWIPECDLGDNVTLFGIEDGPVLRVEELSLPINETSCYVAGWELEQGYSETDLWWYTVESRLLARFYMNWPNYDAEMLFWLTSFNPTGKPVNGSLQIHLSPGWNLIGLPFTSAPLDQLFGEYIENIQALYGYSNGEWKYWLPDVPSTLTYLSGGSGYWIQSDSSFAVTFEGDLVERPSLNSEWNLIAVNTSESISVEDYIVGVTGEVAYIYGYDEVDQTYLYWLNNLLPEYQTLTSMYPGKGYWVYCNP